MMSNCIFDHLDLVPVETSPFAHIILDDVFEQELLRSLIENRPDLVVFTVGTSVKPGEKVHVPSRRSLSSSNIHQCWQQLISEHIRPDKVRLWLEKFSPAISKQYPQLVEQKGNVHQWTIGQRGVDNADAFDVLVDAQISLHVECPDGVAQERSAHVKMTNKLLISQTMLRLADDTFSGGDIELYEPAAGARLLFGHNQQVVNKQRIKLAKTVPYKAGMTVMFLNSSLSIQTMSARHYCPHPIFYLNIILEMAEPLFSLPALLPPGSTK